MEQSNDSDDILAVRAARAQARRVHADDGTEWRIFELKLEYDRRGAALVFESDNVMRRVRRYPPEWRALSDLDLLALSNGR